ncbi:MAG: lysophospholipid transporter LplT [Burkholderiaceae bacterium]|nr:MAG: lysophospholipid transporter LplT [Burkholderiaceae bacterium]
MKRGFYTIMAAQFFSSLADNALLIAAISMLTQLSAPDWMTPLLKLFFVLSYVLLAAFVGAFADSMPKGRVMFITNTIKVVGCALMLFGMHPLLAYGVVGLGAAAYSPAKYGILTELLPPRRLVAANGWIEGMTVLSILLGTFLGGMLISPALSAKLLSIDLPFIDTGISTAAESATVVTMFIYLLAAAINLQIPDTGVRYPKQERHPIRLVADFAHCFKTLWKDKLGQISLGVTTLFWGAGATLQFLVLEWSRQILKLPLYMGTNLQVISAIGIAAGAVLAARRVTLKQSLSVLRVGVGMGVLTMMVSFYRPDLIPAGGWTLLWHGKHVVLHYHLIIAALLLVLLGGMAGYFVVPMNALLQHRGHVLMSAGHSIAVQNFNENIGVLIMLSLYTVLIKYDFSITTTMFLFGTFVAGMMLLVIRKHQANQRQFDAVALISVNVR